MRTAIRRLLRIALPRGGQAALVDEPGVGFVVRQATVADHVVARLRAPALDRMLARAVRPESHVTLTLRARRLIHPRARRRLARSLRRIASASLDREQHAWPPAALGAQVAHAAPELLALAARLESHVPVDARGVALVQALLTDGAGPLHSNRGVERLVTAACEAATALRPAEPSRRDG